MQRKEIEELLERYRSNSCTAEEKILLEQWFDQQAERGSLAMTAAEESRVGERVKQKVDQQLSFQRNYFRIILKVAAVIAVFFIAFLYRTEIYDQVDPIVYVERQVPEGEQLKLTLSDGSKIWLNANSKFKYPKNFNRSIREVFLVEGEAYFDIAHDEDKPFFVRSRKVSTQVLGTAFNIRAYNYLTNIQVAVTRGKVSVNRDQVKNSGVVLLPDEFVNIDTATGTMHKEKVDAMNVISWQKGNISFNNERFANVCEVLERKYKINIYFKDNSLKEYRFTAGFDRKDKLTDVLDILSQANNLSYEVKNKEVYLTKR